jgi:hypothetical protein
MLQTKCPKENVVRPGMVSQTEVWVTYDPHRLVPSVFERELLPCLSQWDEENKAHLDDLHVADYFAGVVKEKALSINKTLDELNAWGLPVPLRKRCIRQAT